MSKLPEQGQEARAEIERIYCAWDEALGAKDVNAILDLYAPDARLESPLVCHLLNVKSGVIEGHEQLKEFIENVFEHQPPQRKRFRTGYFTDGATLTWEYPRESPEGEQMDFVEVMEVKHGRIQHHRVYWGWYGVGMLMSGEHSK